MTRWLCFFAIAVGSFGVAQTPQPVVKEPAVELAGTLFVVGGGTLPDKARDEFVRLAGGAGAKLVVIPTASAAADKEGSEASLAPWKKYNLASLVILHTRDRKKADDAAFVKPLTDATAVWLGGGDQNNLTAAFLGTATEREMHKLLERGGIIGGTSAGAAVMSEVMIAGGNPVAKTAKGFGFIKHAVIDQHFVKRERQKRLEGVLAKNPGLYGIGIDEGTVAVLKGRRMTVLGASTVTTLLSEGGGRTLTAAHYKAADKGNKKGDNTADLIALSRSAMGRTQAPWPPKEPPTPHVPKGTLIIGGGGKMPDEVIKRFIDAAGGPKGHIVFIPTAAEDPIPPEPGEAKRFRALGATSVKVLHTRKPSEANAEPFLAELKKAGGVWFGGGRQWHLVDSYLGTKAEAEMHAVLARGGIIGGSSAGASIQADYMVRGDPLNNIKPMAEGYERGLSFIQGVAIDQHFFKRERLKDMTSVMAKYPQLVGIGIDEQTAIVVRGHLMEVTGVSKVAVYDRRRPVENGKQDYQELTSGVRYDLKERKIVTQPE